MSKIKVSTPRSVERPRRQDAHHWVVGLTKVRLRTGRVVFWRKCEWYCPLFSDSFVGTEKVRKVTESDLYIDSSGDCIVTDLVVCTRVCWQPFTVPPPNVFTDLDDFPFPLVCYHREYFLNNWKVKVISDRDKLESTRVLTPVPIRNRTPHVYPVGGSRLVMTHGWGGVLGRIPTLLCVRMETSVRSSLKTQVRVPKLNNKVVVSYKDLSGGLRTVTAKDLIGLYFK